MLVKVKDHIRRHQTKYIVGVTVVVTAGITYAITRQVSLRYFPTNAMRINKMTIKDNVLYFTTYARKQGPPSYVIRCVETGEIFTSQAEACRQLGIDPARMSRHLNGHPGYEIVSGNTPNWTRAAIAAPASG